MPAHMKDTIATAFQNMAKCRNVDKITVKDLVEECGISRQTFYYHFQDITDVIAWSIQKGLERSLKLSMEAEDSETALQYFVDATKENRPQGAGGDDGAGCHPDLPGGAAAPSQAGSGAD